MKEQKLPTLSAKEKVVLELLLHKTAREAYGLELVRASSGKLKRGTVYVTLGRMEDKGYVESRQEPPPDGSVGMPRRVYRVTGRGEQVYNAWEMVWEQLFGGALEGAS